LYLVVIELRVHAVLELNKDVAILLAHTEPTSIRVKVEHAAVRARVSDLDLDVHVTALARQRESRSHGRLVVLPECLPGVGCTRRDTHAAHKGVAGRGRAWYIAREGETHGRDGSRSWPACSDLAVGGLLDTLNALALSAVGSPYEDVLAASCKRNEG
jgi:hypothetical protein